MSNIVIIFQKVLHVTLYHFLIACAENVLLQHERKWWTLTLLSQQHVQ